MGIWNSHWLHDYATTLRSAWAVMDDFGNLVPVGVQGAILYGME